MQDIRTLVKKRDLEYAINHAERLTPGDFVQACPDVSASKFGGTVPANKAKRITTVMGIVGIVVFACAVGVAIYRLRRIKKILTS